jgi:superfamily II DNA or RNA helicase
MKKNKLINKLINESKYLGTLTRDGYVILKKDVTGLVLKQIKTDLTIVPIDGFGYNDNEESYQVYKETNDTIILPRYYGINKFGFPKNEIDISNSITDLHFNGKLRDYQMDLVQSALQTFTDIGGGIISLYCGGGKTTLALYLACKLNIKTLIIVHKSFLQDQWYDRIKQFTDARVGIIRQNKIDIKDKDIIIGMLQSISQKDYDPEIFKDINLLIVDECHHIASRVFSKTLLKICPRYTLGLSATPTRQDGLTKVIKWFLGDIIVKLERKGYHGVHAKVFEYESNNKFFVEKKQWVKGKIKPNTVKMITNMYKIEERNKFIVDILNALRKKDERKIIVLSGRIEHLHKLKNDLDLLINKDIEEGKCENNEIKTAFYIGKMKEYELKDAAEADIIFGTYGMAEEGLDIEGLNTIVLATPKKNIIQSIGRIMRKPLEEGDMPPLIIDIIDKFSVFEKWGNNRKLYYLNKKYAVNSYYGYNSTCLSIKDYLIFKGKIKQNSEDVDIRKEYICFKYGEEVYELEKEIDFGSFPEKLIYYDPNIDLILNTDDNKN